MKIIVTFDLGTENDAPEADEVEDILDRTASALGAIQMKWKAKSE